MTTSDRDSGEIPLAVRKARMRLTASVAAQGLVGGSIVLLMSGLIHGPGASLAYLVHSSMPYAFLALIVLMFAPRVRRVLAHVALLAVLVVVGSEIVVDRYLGEVAEAQEFCDGRLDMLKGLEGRLSERQLAESILVGAPEILRFMNYRHCVVEDCDPHAGRTFFLVDYMRHVGVKQRGWRRKDGTWYQTLTPLQEGEPRGG